jgi:hypothetical protein
MLLLPIAFQHRRLDPGKVGAPRWTTPIGSNSTLQVSPLEMKKVRSESRRVLSAVSTLAEQTGVPRSPATQT